MVRISAAVLVLFAAGCATAPNPWAAIHTPTAGEAESIGSYAKGCIRGAKSLHADGPGYQVMRPSRRRYYGHPDLVAFVEWLGRASLKAGTGSILVGDLGQPRGGPTLSAHASHQMGLDVDIWFWDAGRALNLDERENLESPSMLTADFEAIDPHAWSARQLKLLVLAAGRPEVERIFINPVIKRMLCAEQAGKPWLQKLRPWWGHDDHFHVRLACPAGDAQCVAQEPVEGGDGCGDALEKEWFSPEAKAKAKQLREHPEPSKMPELPDACAAVLSSPI
ncbi:MAG TPA: penicillin-insensitive murein endopeptidase [Bdellovibrionota bacterium]|jgi:penicillin-insensitive murein endopeptidase|nr:penicillin-insensitive murein endopeptidase [Bdellovibrionota bacterium]